MAGCSSNKKEDSKPPAEEQKGPPQIIETTGGDATFTGVDNKKLWTVYWNKGEITTTSSTSVAAATANMAEVHGQIYKDEKVASTFQSQHGNANNGTKILILTGQVHLHSTAPEMTILCDKVTYNGKLKIIKAKGHVQALGSIETVGTIDELWATPDFSKIGSPELFDKTMTRLLLPALLLLGSHSELEKWTDNKGLTMSCRLLKALMTPTGERHFSMVGNVDVASKQQGLEITSDTMDVLALPEAKNSKTYVMQHAVAAGHVVILKDVDAKGGKQTTRIEGTKADYTAGTTESVVKMSGPVKMQSLDGQNNPTMIATGASGGAVMEPLNKTNLDSGLKRANLDGSVHMTLVQIDPKTHQKTTLHTTSDHMTMENQPKGQKVTLLGGVSFSSDDGSDMTGVQKAVIFIDKKGTYQLETGDK